MKLFLKIFLLTLAAIGFSGSAKADPISSCTVSVVMNPNTAGNSSNVCTLIAGPGLYLSEVVLTGTGDYFGLLSGSPVVSFTGAVSQEGTFPTPFQPLTFCIVRTSGMNSVPCSVLPNPNLAKNPDVNESLTTYSFQLIDVSNTVSGGAVTGDSLTLNLNAFETPITTTGTGTVPEPSSFGLIAAGTLVIALLCWKEHHTSRIWET